MDSIGTAVVLERLTALSEAITRIRTFPISHIFVVYHFLFRPLEPTIDTVVRRRNVPSTKEVVAYAEQREFLSFVCSPSTTFVEPK